MKKTLFIIFCFLSACLHAQVNVGSDEVFRSGKPGKISPEKFSALKKTTTIFTLQFKDYEQLPAFEKAISEVWTVTPYKIVRPDELQEYIGKPGYSFFTFGGYMIKRIQQRGATHISIHLSYDLWMNNLKKPKKDRWLFSKISIYVDAETNAKIAGTNIYNLRQTFTDKVTGQLYNDAEIHSWGPGFLAGYLYEINQQLEEEKTKHNLKEIRNKELLASLKNDTLYVPDYVTLRTGMFYGIQKKDEGKDERLIDAYKYPIKILPAQEINDMIIAGKPIKYLVYIRSTVQNWINVYDSRTHQLLYSEERGLSYNFKNKDLRKLARAID